MAQALQLPPRPQDWNNAQLITFLLQSGEIMPGNLLLGCGSAARALRTSEQVVVYAETAYPALAELVVRGETPGSAHTGQQPKFTAWRPDVGHVLVKFSPADENVVAQRWRDLLIAEHHALGTLRHEGLPAAETRLVFSEGRVFLESRRFDRAGWNGRCPMFSLGVVDAEFAASGGSWYQSARTMHEAGLLSREDLDTIALLQSFGDAIGNTDMHFGNLSLAPEPAGFRLLPVYDMVPMALAPRQGELPPLNRFHPQLRENLPVDTDRISRLAARFWEAIAADAHCSEGFREMAALLVRS